MKQRPATPPIIDVSHLPTVVFGHRASLWWGVVGLLAIEGTVFALLGATYFYLRGGESEWPPPATGVPSLWLTTAALVILLASAAPMQLASRAAMRVDLRGIRLWLIVATALGIVFLVLRVLEFQALTFEWRSHAYGSIFWGILSLHTLHMLTSTAENLLFLALFFKGPVEDKHLLDVSVNSLYWFFVVASWVPFYAILYLEPGLFRP